jgi:hypothetical protein
MPEAQLLPVAEAINGDAQAAESAAGQGDSGSTDPADQLEQLIETMELDQDVVMQYFDIKISAGWENDSVLIARAVQSLKDMSRVGNVCVAKLMGIVVNVLAMGIDMANFNQYVFGKYGKGYTSKPDVLTRIEQEVAELSARPRDEVLALIADALAPV